MNQIINEIIAVVNWELYYIKTHILDKVLDSKL